MISKKYKYFTIQQASTDDPPGKPYYFVMNNKSRGRDTLGVIAWYEPWKKYVLESEQRVIWSADCLANVIEFLNELNKEKAG